MYKKLFDISYRPQRNISVRSSGIMHRDKTSVRVKFSKKVHLLKSLKDGNVAVGKQKLYRRCRLSEFIFKLSNQVDAFSVDEGHWRAVENDRVNGRLRVRLTAHVGRQMKGIA